MYFVLDANFFKGILENSHHHIKNFRKDIKKRTEN